MRTDLQGSHLLGVKTRGLPVAQKALHDLPHPLPALPFSLSPPYSLCFSHMDLPTVPPTHQAQSCPRAFAYAVTVFLEHTFHNFFHSERITGCQSYV